MPGVAILFHRLGPYHYARCRTAGSRCDLTAIEFSGVDRTYQWAKVEGAHGFERMTLFEDSDADARVGQELTSRVSDALAKADPAVVAIPGWSHPGALAALSWCLRRQRPTVIMSDSTARDTMRLWHREITKRRVVALCDAALVAGAPQSDYIRSLGLQDDRVFSGYDTVDNGHFALGAGGARAKAPVWRERLGLPKPFLLASSRFVAKKNLFRLLDAYALYRRQAGLDYWRLVLLGDGELRPSIMSRIADLDLVQDVRLPGFVQYDELPAYYGLAGAFVHASVTEQWGLVVNEAMAAGLPVIVSERCGCAPDLVRDGVNGFTFDPCDVEALAGLMQRVAALSDAQRHALGQASRRIIADWGPDRFAHGLMQAVQVAIRRPPSQSSLFDQALLWALARRPL